jgi:hypothetical protein
MTPPVAHHNKEKASHQQWLSEAICKRQYCMRRLLGSLPYLMDFDAGHRSRVAVLHNQFVRRE